MPIVVIGGGLTAIDTATESLAYYVVQVEKFLKRYETLVAEKGEARGSRGMERGGGRNRRRISGACARHSRRASSRAKRRPQAEPDRPAEFLGRRHHRLPAAHDRRPATR
jgi:NADPH-dependent glutamate synthase beta subunit-like oxidoreductase